VGDEGCAMSADTPHHRPEPRTRLPSSDDDDDRDRWIGYGSDILVVDDNDTNLVAIEAALQPLGRALVLARSGVEALARLLEKDFALIILDVAMPGMDGFETARLVRSRARNRATPIIFITGMSWHDTEILRGYELGAFDFLIKPIRPEVLRAKATVFIQLQERTHELHVKGEELRLAQERAHERELTMQRRRFEAEALEVQMAQMAESERRKDEFLAILAHELRNPLQPLQTAVELMAHERDRPVSDRVRHIIQRQVHHIGRLVDDLLDVARYTAGKLELRRERVVLEDIITEAVAATHAAAESKHHRIVVERGSAVARMYGDPVRLVQILENLLANAIKFTDPRGAITIRWGVDGDKAFVRVSDNGRGISAELLPKIFDMFVQERATQDGAGGLGLGLGLAKRLVELHGGSISAASQGPGKGATFEIRLPTMASDKMPAIARTKSAPHELPLRAVVVDDASDLRELIGDLLRTRGHDVALVADGPSAVELIRAEHPDVALVDIGLPGMDGYEVARVLRREFPKNRLRLIAMTGYGQANDRDAAFAAGFDAHIVKPASVDKIVRALHGNSEESA
jgi:signal transduction histidine kinase